MRIFIVHKQCLSMHVSLYDKRHHLWQNNVPKKFLMKLFVKWGNVRDYILFDQTRKGLPKGTKVFDERIILKNETFPKIFVLVLFRKTALSFRYIGFECTSKKCFCRPLHMQTMEWFYSFYGPRVLMNEEIS